MLTGKEDCSWPTVLQDKVQISESALDLIKCLSSLFLFIIFPPSVKLREWSFIWHSVCTVWTVNLSGQGLPHSIHSINMMDFYS